MSELEIIDYAGAMAALKNPTLAQALYDDGRVVMQDALITLHGEEHTQRRITEFGVFNRAFFRTYESEIFPRTHPPNTPNTIQSNKNFKLSSFIKNKKLNSLPSKLLTNSNPYI